MPDAYAGGFYRDADGALVVAGKNGVSVSGVDAAQASGTAGRQFMPSTAKMESLDRVRVWLTTVTAIATSGTLQVGPLGVLRAGHTLSSLTTYVGNTAGASLTNSWMGIARFSDRNLLAVSPDNTTAAWGAFTSRTFTFGTPYTATVDETLMYCLSVTGTTIPNFYGITLANQSLMSGPVVVGRSNTGLTTPLAAGTTLTALTVGGHQIYVYAS